MGSILPSEVARLVFGYLESENYPEAARVFWGTSRHLQECRDATAIGRKFVTKVNGLTLMQILDLYMSIYEMVQERVWRLDESWEHVKKSADLLAQLEALIEQTPGQRHVANIHQPSQQPPEGSPIISSSMTRRRDCQTSFGTCEKPSRSNEAWPNFPTNLSNELKDPPAVQQDYRDDVLPKMLSTGTDTQELMKFSNTEVQTAPQDIAEGVADEPLENLSLLTMELLNNKELQERIAENINRGITSTDVSMREASFSEALADGNVSMITEFDNFIKNIATVTATDPIFEKALHEIVQPGDEDEIPTKVLPSDSATTAREIEPVSSTEMPPVQEVQDVQEVQEVQDVQEVQEVQEIQKVYNVQEVQEQKSPVQEEQSTDFNAAPNFNIANAPEETQQVSEPIEIPESPKTRRSARLKQKTKPTIRSIETVKLPMVICSAKEANPPIHIPTDKFLPIAPKGVEPLFLRTVTVPVEKHNLPGNVTRSVMVLDPTQHPVPIQPRPTPPVESITLYGSESESAIVQSASLPQISVDDSVPTGTGLSPFLKFKNRREIFQRNGSDSDPGVATPTEESREMTPRTLLKNRPSNSRLSLSTPRRRNSHIRALDFGTPSRRERRLSADASFQGSTTATKPVCRTSLFNSPPSGAVPTVERRGLKVIQSTKKLACGEQSPVPQLNGEWDQVCGVGTILELPAIEETPVEKRSWDSDLRQALISPGPKTPRIIEKSKDANHSLVEGKNESSDEKNNSFNVEKSCAVSQSTTVSFVIDKGVTKKYVQLKTLTTSVTKASLLNLTLDGEEKSMALMTPHKDLSLDIPPTPRFLSPNSSLMTPFLPTSEESIKVQGFISTPDFPPTPSINLTPKQCSAASAKFSTSYYQPRQEQSDEKNQADGSKVEITQFEVIKENLSKEEAHKALGISAHREPARYTDSSNSSSTSCSCSTDCSHSTDSNTTRDKIQRLENESSPQKVFRIEKTAEALETADLVTPAKDEALLEADISDTPCGSKIGKETLTNLSSKISALESDVPWKLHEVENWNTAVTNRRDYLEKHSAAREIEKKATNLSPTLDKTDEENSRNVDELSVLESLELRPTVRSHDNDGSFKTTSVQSNMFINFVHEDSTPKKRRLRHRAPKIGYSFPIELSNDEVKEIKFEASPYIELFSQAPVVPKLRARRAKSEVKVPAKPVPPIVEKKKSIAPLIKTQPLATSSPLAIDAGPSKTTDVGGIKSGKSGRKRKCPDLDCKEPVVKLIKNDLQALLNHVNIDAVLTTLHGPPTK